MVMGKELWSMAQCPVASDIPQGLVLRLATRTVGWNASSVSLQVIPSCVVLLACWREWDAIQRSLDQLEKGICVNLVKFNQCKVLPLSQSNSKYK